MQIIETVGSPIHIGLITVIFLVVCCSIRPHFVHTVCKDKTPRLNSIPIISPCNKLNLQEAVIRVCSDGVTIISETMLIFDEGKTSLPCYYSYIYYPNVKWVYMLYVNHNNQICNVRMRANHTAKIHSYFVGVASARQSSSDRLYMCLHLLSTSQPSKEHYRQADLYYLCWRWRWSLPVFIVLGGFFHVSTLRRDRYYHDLRVTRGTQSPVLRARLLYTVY